MGRLHGYQNWPAANKTIPANHPRRCFSGRDPESPGSPGAEPHGIAFLVLGTAAPAGEAKPAEPAKPTEPPKKPAEGKPAEPKPPVPKTETPAEPKPAPPAKKDAPTKKP